MGHCRLLFVGGRDNLQKIFNNCPDSSSESVAEISIGADWISDWDWLSEEERKEGDTTDDFTKDNKELYQQVIDGNWVWCFDIRNPGNCGEFACLNCEDFEAYNNGLYDREREARNKERTIDLIKTLPDNTIFHFADSHW